MFNTPILFLVFNRPDTTKLVFEQIKLAQPSRFYIASDGPRTGIENEGQVVSDTREWVIRNITWDCEIKTLFRESNLGCGKAVSTAIDWFFENEEMGIIVEDDCLPDLTFFRYCEELLVRYNDDLRVMSICAPNMLQNALHMESSYAFSKYCLVWGWATWRRAWAMYDFTLSDWPQLKKTSWLLDIGKTAQFELYWTNVFDLCYEGRLDTWDYQWINACWRNKGLSILPSVNLVRNIGIGNNSTHLVDERFSHFREQEIAFPLNHPKEISLSKEVDGLLAKEIFTVSSFDYFKLRVKKSKVYKTIKKYF